jgi:hypothetical protein
VPRAAVVRAPGQKGDGTRDCTGPAPFPPPPLSASWSRRLASASVGTGVTRSIFASPREHCTPRRRYC